jgi:hypothetical protein
VLIHALLWLSVTSTGFLTMAFAGMNFRQEAKQQ